MTQSRFRTPGIGLLILLLFASTLSGCWSSVELNKRAFARLMMLDKTEQGVELSLGFPLPNRLGGGGTGGTGTPSSEPPFTVVSKTGRDLSEAYRLMQADLSRKITFGQLRNVLVSDAFAREGVLPIVDFLTRNKEIHINANLMVTEGPAKQIGHIPLAFERFMTDILISYSKEKTVLGVTVKDMLTAILCDGDFLLPMLVFGRMGAQEKRDDQKWMGTDGSALFRQGKMISRLDFTETRMAKWILGEEGSGVMRIASPTDGKIVSLYVYSNKPKIKPELSGDRIAFRIVNSGVAKVIASESTIDVSDRRQLALLEQSFNRDLQDRVRQAIARTQAQRSDAFGLGQMIRWRNPKRWNRLKGHWRDVYEKQVVIESKADVRIEWFGAAQRPIWNSILSETETKQ